MPRTHYEYDGDRLVSSWTDSEWDDDQVAWMLALAEHRAGQCPCGCGQPATESMAADGEGRYRVPPPTRCHARTAILAAQADYREVPQADALLFRSERR